MENQSAQLFPIEALRIAFGDRLQEHVLLSSFTTARVGGPADAMLTMRSADELAETVGKLEEMGAPFFVLGGGSNVLVSDAGFRGVIVLNRARNIRIDARSATPNVYAEAGATLGTVARQSALRGLSGLEWAATVPGTVGGAVYGNAGAHGGNVAGSLLLADILHPQYGRESWSCDRLDYQYRSSLLKREHSRAVILAARFKLSTSTPVEVQARMEGFSAQRRSSQPPGASMGSMFKNPSGDYAGRLIETAGLKGAKVGNAEISDVHANFFVNRGNATAADILALIHLAQEKVAAKHGVRLELEIELIGDWN